MKEGSASKEGTELVFVFYLFKSLQLLTFSVQTSGLSPLWAATFTPFAVCYSQQSKRFRLEPTPCSGSKGLGQLSQQLKMFTALAKTYREYLSLCEEVVLLQRRVLEEQTLPRHIFSMRYEEKKKSIQKLLR